MLRFGVVSCVLFVYFNNISYTFDYYYIFFSTHSEMLDTIFSATQMRFMYKHYPNNEIL